MTTPTAQSDYDLIQTMQTQVPTLEELCTSLFVDTWPDANSNPITLIPWSYRNTLLVAPINLNILSVSISWEYWNLAASDTSYWTGQLQVGAGGTFNTYATRTTQNTGSTANGAVTARTPWTFDAAVTTTTPVSVQRGQLLAMTWAPTGSPGSMKLPVTYTIRYAAA